MRDLLKEKKDSQTKKLEKNFIKTNPKPIKERLYFKEFTEGDCDLNYSAILKCAEEWKCDPCDLKFDVECDRGPYRNDETALVRISYLYKNQNYEKELNQHQDQMKAYVAFMKK